jgi:YaiO family outer membrane protein
MTRRVLALIALLAAASPVSAADPRDGWALDLGGDRAGVTLGPSHAAWWSGRAQVTRRFEGRGGAFGAVETYRRFGRDDVTLIAAGWRHRGPWSFYGEGGVTPRADFYYRWSTEVEAYRRLGGPWAAHAGYRYWAFPGQSLHLFSPRVTRYGRKSELHARLSLVHDATHGTDSQSVLVRGRYDVTGRLGLGGGVAIGERIFDVTALPREPAPGWVAFVEARLSVGDGNSVGLVARVAEEGSTFDQTALGITLRRAF